LASGGARAIPGGATVRHKYLLSRYGLDYHIITLMGLAAGPVTTHHAGVRMLLHGMWGSIARCRPAAGNCDKVERLARDTSEVQEDTSRAARPAASTSPLVTGLILPTLLGLAVPNVLALGMQSVVAIAETSYIGRLGTEPLAAMALVFPLIMLTQMLSSGAMGGGVSSAISRALGAGDHARAEVLALHALLIGALMGLAVSALFLWLGPDIYRLLGGSGRVLDLAVLYSQTFFSGALSIWLFNSLVSIVRGTGDMRLPSSTIFAICLLQIVLGACLSLGFGPVPRLGLPGVAIAQVLSFSAGAGYILWRMTGPHARLRFRLTGFRLRPEMIKDMVVLLAKLAASFGTEALAGFGIGVRLELLLVPIAFAIGVACVPMVGMAIGSDNIARARRVAWTGAALSGLMIGTIGLVVALLPSLWGSIFTSNAGVLAAVATYLSIAGIGFPAYGTGLCLYFASQGSGKILGPVLAGTVRLLVVIVGGWWLMPQDAPFSMLAWLVTAAMLSYGAATALFVSMTRWQRN
jgi:putative MATE family efflux protein